MLDSNDTGDKQTASSHGDGNAVNYIIKDGITSRIALVLAVVGMVLALLLILILPALGVYLKEHRHHKPFGHATSLAIPA